MLFCRKHIIAVILSLFLTANLLTMSGLCIGVPLEFTFTTGIVLMFAVFFAGIELLSLPIAVRHLMTVVVPAMPVKIHEFASDFLVFLPWIFLFWGLVNLSLAYFYGVSLLMLGVVSLGGAAGLQLGIRKTRAKKQHNTT